ncbi:hypothetical protein MATL_G00022300 [Megalops atlanticus]|uniref:Uncharacterized protein n=1 Tax=Megalops atlanticus TaxID=7932 RepID=A0A9D3QH12_MEGAT|nr:hypothetical protein MATL_G00022300 [Megalops atlanticus]
MSACDRNLDLSFLTGEEADLIRAVLERDRRLKKREEERLGGRVPVGGGGPESSVSQRVRSQISQIPRRGRQRSERKPRLGSSVSRPEQHRGHRPHPNATRQVRTAHRQRSESQRSETGAEEASSEGLVEAEVEAEVYILQQQNSTCSSEKQGQKAGSVPLSGWPRRHYPGDPGFGSLLHREQKLQDASGVWHLLKAGSGQGTRDVQSSLSHPSQPSLNVKFNGKSSTEQNLKPNGSVGRQRDDRAGTAVLKEASFRTRLTSFFSFKFPQQRGVARQRSGKEGGAKEGGETAGGTNERSFPPPDAARCVAEAWKHSQVNGIVIPGEAETPSLHRAEVTEEDSQLKENSTVLGHKENRTTEPEQNQQPQGGPRTRTGAQLHSDRPSEGEVQSTSLPVREWEKRCPKETRTLDAAALRRVVSLPSLCSLEDDEAESLSRLSRPSAMLSSALVSVLAPPWSGRFRRHKRDPADAGEAGKGGSEAKQEPGGRGQFPQPYCPLGGEISGPSDAASRPFTGPRRQRVTEAGGEVSGSRRSTVGWLAENSPSLSKRDPPVKPPLQVPLL